MTAAHSPSLVKVVTVLTHSTAVAGGWHDPPICMQKNHRRENTPHLCCHITPRLSRLWGFTWWTDKRNFLLLPSWELLVSLCSRFLSETAYTVSLQHQKFISFHSRRLESFRSMWQIQFLVKVLFLECRQLISPCTPCSREKHSEPSWVSFHKNSNIVASGSIYPHLTIVTSL